MELEVLFPEPGMPKKLSGCNFRQQRLTKSFSKVFSPTKIFCRNFLNFWKLTYNFGAFNLGSFCSLMHELKFLRGPTFTPFWPFVSVWNFLAQPKMVKSQVYVVLFHPFFPYSRKIFEARLYSSAYSIHRFGLFGGTPVRLRGNFWPTQISDNIVIFRWRKFDFRCITSEFGILKMCKYFLYILTCIRGCNIWWWWCLGLLKKHSAKDWACGSKPCAKVLGAYVCSWFRLVINAILLEFLSIFHLSRLMHAFSKTDHSDDEVGDCCGYLSLAELTWYNLNNYCLLKSKWLKKWVGWWFGRGRSMCIQSYNKSLWLVLQLKYSQSN